MNDAQKLQTLTENYNAVDENKQTTLREYVEHNAANDPNFFRWFFNADLDKDFDNSLTDEQRKNYNEFLSSL